MAFFPGSFLLLLCFCPFRLSFLWFCHFSRARGSVLHRFRLPDQCSTLLPSHCASRGYCNDARYLFACLPCHARRRDGETGRAVSRYAVASREAGSRGVSFTSERAVMGRVAVTLAVNGGRFLLVPAQKEWGKGMMRCQWRNKNPPVEAGGAATSYFPRGLPPKYRQGWKA